MGGQSIQVQDTRTGAFRALAQVVYQEFQEHDYAKASHS